MNIGGNRFEIDRPNGKLLGVCAGLANATGIDATILRIGLVVVTLLGAFPWTLLAYGAAALIGKPRRHAGYALSRPSPSGESSERVRDLDARMQAIETYVANANGSLAREIEELR